MHEGEGQRAFKKLASLLERLMLRRTKVERADDLGLPPRVVKVREDYFTEEEEEVSTASGRLVLVNGTFCLTPPRYAALPLALQGRQAQVQHLRQRGNCKSALLFLLLRPSADTLTAGAQQLLEHVRSHLSVPLAHLLLLTHLSHSLRSFTLITRMRQMADHPDLVLKSKTAMPVLHAAEDKPEDIITCRICLDEAEDPVKTQCRHLFCRECIRQYLESALENKPQCPVCNLPVSIDLEQDAIEQDTTGRQGLLGRLDPSKVRTSTKIEALYVLAFPLLSFTGSSR